MPAGKLIVLTGPSGVGKGTLVKKLRLRFRELYLSVSATTRAPRPGEKDGKDYHFVSKLQFESMVEAGELLEWAQYADNYYGTPRFSVEEQLALGNSVILEIELVGARAVKKVFPDSLRIFILPPSLAELERRIRRRGKDSQAAIDKRLERAKQELAAKDEFDHKIVNDDLAKALAQVEEVIANYLNN